MSKVGNLAKNKYCQINIEKYWERNRCTGSLQKWIEGENFTNLGNQTAADVEI